MTSSIAAAAAAPALAGWRTVTIALGCALLIGGIGGLIGLGGGEFRLPIFGRPDRLQRSRGRADEPNPQPRDLGDGARRTLAHRIACRGRRRFAPAVIALGIGGVTAAWFAARLLSRVSDHRLERAIAILLMAIGVLLIGERFLPAGLPALVPAEPGAQIVAGIALGLCIGTASTFLGVAGGELLIPTLIFVFGADIHIAGSAVLLISIPTVCMGLFRYGRMGLLPGRSTLLRIGLPMGIESFVGAATGGAFAGSTSAEVLKLMLGVILVAAAFKAFWRQISG